MRFEIASLVTAWTSTVPTVTSILNAEAFQDSLDSATHWL